MIDVSGVRSSWLTVARKLDLSRSMSFSWTFISSRRLFWVSSSRLFSSVASMCTWLVRKVFCPAATSVSQMLRRMAHSARKLSTSQNVWTWEEPASGS